MEQVRFPQPQQRRDDDVCLVSGERDLLDAFRQLSEADQARVRLLARSLAWAAGPLPSRR